MSLPPTGFVYRVHDQANVAQDYSHLYTPFALSARYDITLQCFAHNSVISDICLHMYYDAVAASTDPGVMSGHEPVPGEAWADTSRKDILAEMHPQTL